MWPMDTNSKQHRAELLEKIEANLSRQFGRTRESASPQQLYVALSTTIRDEIMTRYTQVRTLERELQPHKHN